MGEESGRQTLRQHDVERGCGGGCAWRSIVAQQRGSRADMNRRVRRIELQMWVYISDWKAEKGKREKKKRHSDKRRAGRPGV